MNFSNISTPEQYRALSFMARESAEGLLNRLELMRLKPKTVLDLGCGLGEATGALQRRYPEARVVGVDLAESYLRVGQAEQASGLLWLLGDSSSLAFSTASVDLIFANALLPWLTEPGLFLKECLRVLRPEGLLLFSALGTESFKESGPADFIPGLSDPQKLGEALLATGFIDPVLEVEKCRLTYRSLECLKQELVGAGFYPEAAPMPDLEQEAGLYPLSIELVYAHAFCPSVKVTASLGPREVRIPIAQIKK